MNFLIGIASILIGLYYLNYGIRKFSKNEYIYRGLQLQYAVIIWLCLTVLGLLFILGKISIQDFYS